jgi:GAF domain-containing protein/CheY-like chemotaxis protein
MSAERDPREERTIPEQARPERASGQDGKKETPPGKAKRAKASSSQHANKRVPDRIGNLFANLDKEPVEPCDQKPTGKTDKRFEKDLTSKKPDSPILGEETIDRGLDQPQVDTSPKPDDKSASEPPSEETPILAPEIFIPKPRPPRRDVPKPEQISESPETETPPEDKETESVIGPSFQPPAGKARVLGFQSFSQPEGQNPKEPGGDGKGGSLDEEVLPASTTMTPIAQDSLRLQQLVARSAQADQPAMLAYSRPFEDLKSQPIPWGEYQDGGAPARVAQSLLLEILDENPNRTWSEDELLLVEQVTDQLSLALENARLHEETRRQLKEQIALRQATAVLSSAMDTNTILARLTEQMCNAINATSAYICSYNPETLESTVITEYFSSQASPFEKISDLGQTYMDAAESAEFLEMIDSGQSLISHYDDPDKPEPEREHMARYGAKSILYIPLIVQNRTVGVSEIWESRQRREFTATETNLCQDISRQAAVAMERAMLFEQTQNALSALEISERYQKSVAQAVAVLTERGIASLSDVLRILGQAANASRAYYIETQVDPRGSYWRLIAEWCSEGTPSQLSNPDLRRLSARWLSPWLDNLKKNGYVSLIVNSANPEEKDFFEKLGTRSILQFAVAGRHEIPGCIGFEQIDYDRQWNDDEISALQTAASALANTISREDLFTQVQINLAETEALYQASAHLNSASTYDAILGVLRQHTILGHVNAAHITLNLFDRPWTHESKPEWLIPVTHWAAKSSEEGMALPDRYPLSTWKTAEQLLNPDRPTVVMDVESSPLFDDVSQMMFVEPLAARSLIFLPLNVSGRWIGQIIAAYRQTTGFPDQDIRRLFSLAGQSAVAIESLRLLEETRQRNEELATLNQVTAAVSRTLELNEILGEILSRLLAITEYDSGLISIAEPISRRLYLAVHENLPERMVHNLEVHGLENTPCDLVYQLGRLVNTPDIYNLPEELNSWSEIFEKPKAIGFHSYIGVPLLSKGIKLGTVCLFNRTATSLNPSRLSLMEAIGQQLGVVVDNARLFQSTQNALSETETLYQASAEFNAVQSFDDILQTLRHYSILGDVDYAISLDLFDHPWIGAKDENTRLANMPEIVTVMARWGKESKHTRQIKRTGKTGGLAIRDAGQISSKELSDEIRYYKLQNFPAAPEIIQPDEVIAINDIHQDPRFTQGGEEIRNYYSNKGSVIYIPLVVGGLWVGLIHAMFNTPTQWQEKDLRRLEVLSAQAAVAAQNLRQVQEIQARAQYEYLTREIGTQISSTIDRDTILRTAARALCLALNASHTLINLRKPEAGYLYEQKNDKFYPADDPLVISLIDRANRTSAAKRTMVESSSQETVVQNFASIALRGDFLGTIRVFDDTGGTEWSDNDDALMQAVSSQVALALDNARLFQETQAALTETETLYQASAELNAVQSYDDILQTLRKYTILGQADRLLSISLFNRPWIGNREEDIPEWVTPIAHWTVLPPEKLRWKYSLRNYPTAKLLSPTEVVVFEDIPSDPRLDAEVRQLYTQDFQAHSAIFIPLYVGGLWIGFLNGVYALATHFDEQEMRRVLAIAGQAAVAVQNLSSLQLAEQRAQEAQRRSEELALVNDIVVNVSASLDLHNSLEIVASEMSEALDAYVDIALLNQEQQTLTVVSQASPTLGIPSTLGLNIPLADNLTTQKLAQTRQSFLINKPRRDPLTLNHGIPVSALLVIPLVSGAELIGTVGLKILSDGRSFKEDETRLAETIVLQAATAIQNARLFEQTQQVLAETEALYQASAHFQAAKAYNDILHALSQYTILGENPYSVSIDLYDRPWESDGSGTSQMPEWATSIARKGSLPVDFTSPRYLMHAFPSTEKLLKPDEVTVIESVQDDVRLDENLRALYVDLYQVQSVIYAPLVASGQWIGHINAFYQDQASFTDDEIRRLSALAGQAAVAIQNLRLIEESQRRANQLQTAAEIARDTSGTLALELLLQRSTNLLCERFSYYHASIFLLDESGVEAVIRESTGAAGEEMKRRGHSLPVGGRSVIGQVTATGESIVLNDVSQPEAQFIHRPNPLLPLTKAELAIALKIGDRVIGALDVQSTRANVFSDDDIAVLQILSDQIAVAVDNARSYELSQKAVEEIREADRLKSQFLANMSHELRTPLNSIIGFSRVILKGIDGPINDLQQQDLSAIYNSGQHLLGLINDVLDLSKIEAGKMELTFEEDVNLADIIKGVMSTTVGLVKDKHIQLKQDIAPNLPLMHIDPMKIRQVLLNLLSNAAKFTEEGSISVTAGPQIGPTGKQEILIQVIDTGPGIAPQDQLKLFQPFSQVDGSLTRKTGGSGLGLSICHHLIRLHGGRIGLKSKVGSGSTFYFTLPVEGPESPVEFGEVNQPELPDMVDIELASLTDQDSLSEKTLLDTPEAVYPDDARETVGQLEAEQERPSFEKQTIESLAQSSEEILTIDKDPQVGELYKRYLTDHNYSVVTITELDQAVTVARGMQPSVITLDVAMHVRKEPESANLDGWQVLKALRTDPGTRHIPVLVCTILNQEQRAYRLGASGYLLKPILEDDLIQAIQNLLNKR